MIIFDFSEKSEELEEYGFVSYSINKFIQIQDTRRVCDSGRVGWLKMHHSSPGFLHFMSSVF